MSELPKHIWSIWVFEVLRCTLFGADAIVDTDLLLSALYPRGGSVAS